jgi:Flp pilus assembly CpaE family ATPase
MPAALDAAWSVARQQFVTTVVDVGFSLEHDELAWFEPGTVTRNQATIKTLAAADTVITVCGADPVGLVRFLRSLPTLRGLAPTARVHVVANRVPAGRAAQNELRGVLARHAGEAELSVVPDDANAFSTALGAGQTLAEAAPRSAARRAVLLLAEQLVGVSGRRRGRRAA